MSTHNIYFRGEISKIICGYLLLSGTMDFLSKLMSHFFPCRVTSSKILEINNGVYIVQAAWTS